MPVLRCTPLLAGLAIAAAAVATPSAHAGFTSLVSFAPGVYYFDGTCTTCDVSRPLATAASDSSGVLTVGGEFGSASFSFTSPQITFSDYPVFSTSGSQPTDRRSARDISLTASGFVVFFIDPDRPYLSLETQSTGTWSLAFGSQSMAGTGGTWVASPVPEPQSWALMLVGLAAAGAMVWSRRRA